MDFKIDIFHQEILYVTRCVRVCVGIQKSLKSDFDMAYERGRISLSAEDGTSTLSFSRVRERAR